MSVGPVPVAVARRHLRRHWRSLVLLGLVAGLVGGVATAAFAGARRTSTAYDRLLTATEAPDAWALLIESEDPAAIEVIRASDAVERARVGRYTVGLNASTTGSVLVALETSQEALSRVALDQGRLPEAAALDEIVLSTRLAESLELGVGDVWPYHALNSDDFADLLRDRWDGTASGPHVDLRVVGVGRAPTDVTMADFPIMIGTPALDALLDTGPVANRTVAIDLADGATAADLMADVPELAADRAGTVTVIDFGAERVRFDRGVTVLTLGLLAFGAVTALAGLVLLVQLVARCTQRVDDDRAVLRDLGLSRRERVLATSAGGMAAAGSSVAVTAMVAVVASRWMPIGAAARVEPYPGFEVNLAFVVPGAVGVALVLALLVWTSAVRAEGARTTPVSRGRARAAVGGPMASVATCLALGAGHSTSAPSTRRVVFAGTAVALSGLVGTMVFASSLDRFVSNPVGWGAIADTVVEVPEPIRATTYDLLDTTPEVEAWAELRGRAIEVAGSAVDAYWFAPHKGSLTPVLLEGRLPGEGEVALGPTLLADLGLEVGDAVAIDGQDRWVVGSTLPFGRSEQSGYTSGVLFGGPAPDDPLIFTTALVRFVDGLEGERAAELEGLFGMLEHGAPPAPVEVTNLRDLRPLPQVLAGVVAVIALIALVQVAFGMAARGRADLAVLRCMGMDRRRAIGAVVVGALLSAGLAIAIGLPLGIALGTVVWRMVEATTGFAAAPQVPGSLALVGVATVAAAAGLGTVAGLLVVRQLPARVLRSE